MREIMEMVIPMILVLCLIAAIIGVGEPEYDGIAGEPECDSVTGEQECGGLYKGRRLTPEELTSVLRTQHVWLNFEGEPNDIWRANLCYANLRHANLRHADLRDANLQHVNLRRADLRHANLQHANVRCAILWCANLQKAKLERADLQEAELIKADLQGGNLFKANLKEANLWDANFQGVHLDRANVEKADLGGVRLQDAVYEPNPDPGELPDFWTLAHPRNRLDTLVFHYSPAALMALRKAFKEGGMRTQERQLTYAIERTKRRQDWDPSWHDNTREDERWWGGKAWGKLESGFKYVAFEFTSDYGMSYGRPLKILLVSILGFSCVYMAAFGGLFTTHGRAGIWATWPPDRVDRQDGPAGESETSPMRVTRTFILPRVRAWAARRGRRLRRTLLRGFSILSLGLYFSLLSAFSLGWRDLTVGTWISRLQPREYILRATGWVRVMAGLQSLLSIYLLALWVLTYFGRPFE